MTQPDASAPAPEMDRLYRACRAVADSIAEFDTVTDGELIDDLERALDALTAPGVGTGATSPPPGARP